MTASDKKKSVVLGLLLAVAGVSWYNMYGPAEISPVNPATTKTTARGKAAKITQEAQIRTDILNKSASLAVGQKNLFQYRQKAAPPKPAATGSSAPPQIFVPPPVSNPTPPAPVVQPFKNFRYEGFSVPKNSAKILGSITEGGNTYEVSEGECVMGQYCVTRLTENLVEIEDLILKRRQTFTRVQ
jgi:hypothetical protein